MVAINMRLFKTVLVFVLISANVEGLPVEVSSELPQQQPSSTAATELPKEHYDQRQNGTENYRIDVDGLVLVVAPVEALLLAGGLAGGTESNLLALGQGGLLDISPAGSPAAGNVIKPKPEADNASKVIAPKSVHRPGLRLANLIAPLLRRVQQ